MKTTNKHFAIFKEAFTSYQKMFGLKPGYEIYFFHKDLKDCYADIGVDQDSKKVTVRFTSTWLKDSVKPLTDVEIRKTALHECIHLLISRLSWIARCRFVGEEEVAEEDHNITVRLVEIISELEGKKK